MQDCFAALEKTGLHFLPNGGVEQDPEQWWEAVVTTSARLMAGGKVNKKQIAAVSVSSTFSSTVAVDARGRALCQKGHGLVSEAE